MNSFLNIQNINYNESSSVLFQKLFEAEAGKVMVRNYFQAVDLNGIFKDFLDNNLSEIFPKPATVESSSNSRENANVASTKANSRETKVNTCIHGDRPYYAKVEII